MTAEATTRTSSTTAGIMAERVDIEMRARDMYRALRDSGCNDTDIMAFAGELLSLVATNVRSVASAE